MQLRQRPSFQLNYLLILKLLHLVFSIIYFVHCEEEEAFNTEAKFPVTYSLIDLEDLATTEKQIYGVMSQYQKILFERINIVQGYLKEYEDTLPAEETELWNKPEYDHEFSRITISHPLLAFRMLRRLAYDLYDIENHISSDFEDQVVKLLYGLKKDLHWPTKSTVESSMDRLLRLQLIYDLHTHDLAEGDIGGFNTKHGVSAFQATHIADHAHLSGFHAYAVEWLRAAEEKVKQRNDITVDETDLTLALKTFEKAHDDAWDIDDSDMFSLFENKIGDGLELPKKRSSTLTVNNVNSDDPFNVYVKFIYLCSGLNLQSLSIQSTLTCRYDSSMNSYWKIHPLKIEELSQDPYLVQIYDVVGTSVISRIEELAITKLTYINKVNVQETDPEDETHSSTTVRLNELEDETSELTFLERKIEMITGLNVVGRSNSEMLQVTTYILGGYYDPHLDALVQPNTDDMNEEMHVNDRIATVLLAISEFPSHGGNTVFPVIGVIARPVKGSALFWFNNLKNGKVDSRMMRASCPIVFGQKWAANKWILSRNNFLKRQCSMDPEE